MASVGSAAGAYIGFTASIPLVFAAAETSTALALGVLTGGIVIGAFIGFILGDLIGSLFGHHKPRVPSAMAETVLQIPTAQYALGSETAANGGDLAFADGMARAARDTLNGIIAQITHGAKPSFVSNTASPTQTYGYSGSQIYVKYAGLQHNVTSADLAVDQGVLWALPQTKIIGGDLFLKRALANGQEPSVTALLGDLQIASDYETYLKDEPVIDAAIASTWNSLSTADQVFYSANQAFMTRAISKTELPLDAGDTAFYNANQATVDRIIGSISVSTFAAGWITTLARAAELKLGEFTASDFNGGLAGFLQSFGIASTGSAVHYEDASVTLANGNLGISLAGSAAAGTFSLLPQAVGDGHAIQIDGFGATMGYTTGSTSAITNGSDLITSTAPVTLFNASFEQPAYATGVSGAGVAYWGSGGQTGTWNPGGLIRPSDGTNVAYLDDTDGNNTVIVYEGFGTYVPGSTYTFTVDVGGRTDGPTGLGTTFLQLYASGIGSKALAVYNPDAPLGTMQSIAVSYTATAADAGQTIGIYIGVGGAPGQVAFDNPRVTEVSASGMTVDAGNYGYDYGEYGYAPATNGGDDIIVGGNGNDTLSAGVGSVWIDGGGGNDTIVGGAGRDVLLGGDGWDNIYAGSGDTYLAGGAGNDLLVGGAGNDTLVGGAGIDTMLGGDGNDTFIVDPDGGGTWDYMDGGAGSDTVSFERLTSGVTVDMRANPPGVASSLTAQYLYVGQQLFSPDGRYRLIYQGDGNLVLYGPTGGIWSSQTGGHSAGFAVIQSDGNLVVYDASSVPVWASGTDRNPYASVKLQNSGHLGVYGTAGNQLWTAPGSGPADGAATATSPVMTSATYLYPGQWRYSANGQFGLVYQGDGNLVMYGPGGALMASNTSGTSAGVVAMQAEGNLVIYNASGQAVWGTPTMQYSGAALYISDDGRLSINDAGGTERWWAGAPIVGGYTSRVYGDAWNSIENVNGTNYDDVLTGLDTGSTLKGLAGNDVLNGGAGNDVLEGGAGADVLHGGGGVNTASYVSSSAGVYMNLATGTAIGGDASDDTFSDIQNITGSASGDELAGDGGVNVLDGSAGDDWLDATAGADTYQGGEGFDTVDYSLTSFVAGSGQLTGYYDDGNGGQVPYTYSGTAPAIDVTIGASGGSVTYRNADGSTGVQTLSSIEQVVGTPGYDVFRGSGNVTVTWDGGAGDDTYYGGSGSDTFVFGRNYGNDVVVDGNASSNVVKFGADLTFDDLVVNNLNNGSLQFNIRGDTGSIVFSNSIFAGGNDVIKTLDLGGVAQVDLTQINVVVIGNDASNVVSAPQNASNIIFAYGGNDTIDAGYGGYGSVIDGGLGDDHITSYSGDDQFLFERGDGRDVVTDSGGQNTVVFGSTVGADDVIYEVVGENLYVGIKDLSNPSLSASHVTDYVEFVRGGVKYFDTGRYQTPLSVEAGGATTDLTKANILWNNTEYDPTFNIPPFILDLNGDGLELSPIATSDIVTKDAAGNVLRTSWVGPTNGILAYDRDADGQINNTADISFVGDKKGATTDLEGLAGWDSNADGILDAKDEGFGKLVVWVDANQDGRAEATEVKTLAALGIAAINLTPSPTGFDGSDTGESVVRNTTTFTRTDGTSGRGYDVSLARQLLVAPESSDVRASIDQNAVATIGQLKNDPVALANAGALKGGRVTSATVSALADVDISAQGGAISAADAARWADYLDPAKIAARKAVLATGVSGSEFLDQLRTTTAYLAGADTLTGRAAHNRQTRLQAIVIDFNHDGPSLIDPSASHAIVDAAHDGSAAEIGWVSGSDGLLAYDRNNDGRVDASTELSFLADVPDARTNVQGLSAFDNNHDGVLSAADGAFARFLIWRDANGNGVSDPGEVQTLSQAGVAQLDLAGSVVRPDRGTGASNDVLGVGQVTFTDGSTRAMYDIALGYADAKAITGVPGQPITGAPGGTIASPATPATATGSDQAPGSAADAGATPGPSTGMTSVGRAQGSVDGPSGAIVEAAAAGSDDAQWWRDAAIVGQNLASLGTLQALADTSLGSNRSSILGTGNGTDAATLQRLMLLRQNIASLHAASGGSAAIWSHDAANDVLPTLASSAQHGMASTTLQTGAAA